MQTHRWHGEATLWPTPVRGWLPAALGTAGAAAGVCVLVRGRQSSLLTFGERVRGSGEAIEPQHAFAVASLAKAAVALVVAQAAERSLLDPEAPVAKLLPAWRAATPEHQATVTLRQLLGNCSGLGPVWPLDEMLGPQVPPDVVLARMAALPARRAPGERFEYLNLGFVAAAAAAEQATGRPYAELLHEAVFAPMGMTHSASAARWPALDTARVAAHAGNPPEALNGPVYTNHQGAGWLAMSGADAVRWMQGWLGTGGPGAKLPLADAGRLKLLQPVVGIEARDAGLWIAPPDATGAGYGWGWAHAQWRGLHLVQHSGASVGCTAHITLLPALGLGIATFLSGGRLYRAALHYALLEALLGLPNPLGAREWLRHGEAAMAEIEVQAQPSPAARAAPLQAAKEVTGRWFAPGCGAVSIDTAAYGGVELAFDDAPHWRCRLLPCGGREWATELIEPNDGLRFMQSRPIGRFEPAAGRAERFVHLCFEPLMRLAA